MNTELRKKTKNDFEKDLYKLMINAVFGKTMENVRNHRDIRLVTTDKKRSKLVSKPNYYTTKWFSKRFLAIEIKKIKVKMNKPVYLGFSILEISKTRLFNISMDIQYGFWYDYIKQKYRNNVKLCYTGTDGFIFNVKTEDFYEDIANEIEKKFDTSNYEVNRPSPKGKNKKVIGAMKDELGRKIMTELVGK